jgi:flagellar basal body-associated protein FliL
MLTTNSYSYVANDTLHSFQIISQTQPSNNPSEQNTIPIIPLLIFILVLFMAIFVVFLFLNNKKKKSYEKWKEEKTSFQINEKPETNIKQKTNEKPTTKKKPQTKRKPRKK